MEHVPIRAGADTREHLVVIGNGMAGCRAVEELIARDPARYRVTIFGAEPLVNYNRIMLSPVLAGEKSFDDIVINGADWYADHAITLMAGDPVVAIDRDARSIARSRDARARSIDPSDALDAYRDANSTTDGRRDARDATQVVFAVLGGWAVVIAGARRALS